MRVYRGKPAEGCVLCRKRRLLCDRRRPSCSQCLRVNQECSGYQDPNSLRVYDQTQEVTQKALARRSVARKSKSTSPVEGPSTALERPASPARIRSPPISNDDRAVAHLFTYFVGTAKKNGVYWYLSYLLKSESSPALLASVKALGLASMAGIEKMPTFKRASCEQYCIALRATNDALQDPILAKSDSTLTAVAMLSTYELVTCPFTNMRHNWANHIQGGIKLLELRGEEQLNSAPGLALFRIMKLLSATSGVMFGDSRNYSPRILELSELSKAKQNENFMPVEVFYDMLVKMNDISIRINTPGKSTEDFGAILREALYLDADLRLWPMSLSESWKHTVINRPSSAPFGNPNHSLIYGDGYHMYYDIGIAGIWNFYRQTRLIVNQIIRAMALGFWNSQKTAESEQIISQASAVIDQMVDDICATVQFYFISGPQALASIIRLCWPLFISAHCTDKRSAKYKWISQTFDTIAKVTGFEQIISMSDSLRDGNTSGVIPGVP